MSNVFVKGMLPALALVAASTMPVLADLPMGWTGVYEKAGGKQSFVMIDWFYIGGPATEAMDGKHSYAFYDEDTGDELVFGGVVDFDAEETVVPITVDGGTCEAAITADGDDMVVTIRGDADDCSNYAIFEGKYSHTWPR